MASRRGEVYEREENEWKLEAEHDLESGWVWCVVMHFTDSGRQCNRSTLPE